MTLTRHFRASLTVDFSVSEKFYQVAGSQGEKLVREEIARAFVRAAERGRFQVETVTRTQEGE